MKIKPVGITGVARAGKDTLFKLIQKHLGEKGLQVQRIALADPLKSELDSFLIERFGISAFTEVPQEKELIRPMLVAYAKVKRISSKGTYWTSIAQKKVEDCLSKGIVPVITDVRYDQFPEDELWWLKTKNNGVLIHISRVDTEGKIIQPPNVDEAENDPKLKDGATFGISWKTPPDSKDLLEDLKHYGIIASDLIIREFNE
jgi:hypothetical protein